MNFTLCLYKVKNQLDHGIISLVLVTRGLKVKIGKQAITASSICVHPHVILLTRHCGNSREKGRCLLIVMQIKISFTHTTENQCGRNPRWHYLVHPSPCPRHFWHSWWVFVNEWQCLCSSNETSLLKVRSSPFSILKMHFEKNFSLTGEIWGKICKKKYQD